MSNTDFETGRLGDLATGGGKPRLVSPSSRLTVFCCLLLTAFCLLSAGCRQDMQDQPKYEYYEAGDKKFFADGASSRAPVEGTVARASGEYRDREDYFYTGKAAGAAPNTAMAVAAGTLATASTSGGGNAAGGVPGAREAAATGGPDDFPIPLDKAALERGRQRFQIFCTACHGMTGEGDGMIVRRGFRKPPSFYDDRLREGVTPAAHFFDVITNGWGAMPDYASQIPPEDRWKIIAYLRALQLSRRLKLEELSPDEQNRVRSGAQPTGGEHGDGTTPLQSQRGGEKH
jgi:mono/diheme cytochrome c family protein